MSTGNLLIFSVLASFAAATVVHAESVVQVLDLAKKNDPQYQAAKLEMEALGFGVKAARSGLLPSVSVAYAKTKTTQDILASGNTLYSVGNSSYPQTDLSLSITQPILRLASWRQLSQAKANERGAQEAYAAALQDLIVRTAKAYTDVLEAHNTVALEEAKQKSLQGQMELTESKYKSGKTTIVGLKDVQARVALNVSDLVAARNDLQDKIEALEQITGKEIDRLDPIGDKLKLAYPAPMDAAKWVGLSLRQNYSIKAQQDMVDAAGFEVRKQRAGAAPTLDLSLTQDRKNSGGSVFGGGSDINETDMTLNLRVPIYDGGMASAATSAAAKRHEEAQFSLDRQRRLVKREALAAYNGVVGGIERVHALGSMVGSLDAAYQLKLDAYKAGLVNVVAVLDAERDLVAAKRDQVQARYDYMLNVLKLKQAAGTLTEADAAAWFGSAEGTRLNGTRLN